MRFKVFTVDFDGKSIVFYAETRHACKKYIVGRWGYWPSFVGITVLTPSKSNGFKSW